MDGLAIGDAFQDGWQVAEGRPIQARVWEGMKAATPVVAANAWQSGVFAVGSGVCGLTTIGEIVSGICGAGAVFISDVVVHVFDTPGAPATYCSSGSFNSEQADAMGFHHTSEAVVGCSAS